MEVFNFLHYFCNLHYRLWYKWQYFILITFATFSFVSSSLIFSKSWWQDGLGSSATRLEEGEIFFRIFTFAKIQLLFFRETLVKVAPGIVANLKKKSYWCFSVLKTSIFQFKFLKIRYFQCNWYKKPRKNNELCI